MIQIALIAIALYFVREAPEVSVILLGIGALSLVVLRTPSWLAQFLGWQVVILIVVLPTLFFSFGWVGGGLAGAYGGLTALSVLYLIGESRAKAEVKNSAPVPDSSAPLGDARGEDR